MTAFEQAWLIVKDFRFMGGFPGILQGGAYDPKTDELWANLASHVSGYGGMNTDEERAKELMQTLGHESVHQALHPPYTDDLWDAVSMRGLKSGDIDEKEKRRLQARVDEDWQRFQEYGAWSATPGIDEDEKWKRLAMYGIYPKEVNEYEG